MKKENMCKFVPPKYHDTISVSCFVKETDFDAMMEKNTASANRMMLVTKGSGTFFFDETPVAVSSNTLVFLFDGENFRVQPDKECEYMYICFKGSRSDELFRRFNIHKHNRIFPGFDSLVPMWKESLSRADTQTVDLASESILYYTFSRFKSAISAKNTLFHQVLDIIETEFTDASLSLGGIAKRISYNPKYISNIFKKEMKVGFSEYIKTLRIKHAISLFDYGLDSVKNVAILSGFTDPLYFSTVFKNETGVSPKDYIKSIRD